jgi:hypothetical protein
MTKFFWVFAIPSSADLDDEATTVGTPPTRPGHDPVDPMSGEPEAAEPTFPTILDERDPDNRTVRLIMSPLMFDEESARAYVAFEPCRTKLFINSANAQLYRIDD